MSLIFVFSLFVNAHGLRIIPYGDEDLNSFIEKNMMEMSPLPQMEMAKVEMDYQQKQASSQENMKNFNCNLPQGQKFMMLTGAWEQFGGWRHVVAEALSFAKESDITFVEPVVQDGRIVSPWQMQFRGIPMRQVLDVDEMKKFHPKWMAVEDFMKACKADSGKPMSDITYVMQGETWNSDAIAQLQSFVQSQDKQIVQLSHFKRSAGNEVGFVSAAGVPMYLSKDIIKKSDEIRQAWKEDYVCVQWRHEDSKSDKHEETMQCAEDLLEATMPLVGNKKVLLLTDVREGTSDTFTYNTHKAEATKLLQDKLKFQEQAKPLWSISDKGIRAVVELHLCAASSQMVACPFSEEKNAQTAGKCGRCSKNNSKFTKYLQDEREFLHKPAATPW